VITTILFDVGDTLVHASPPGTAVADLVPRPVEGAGRTLRALAGHYRLGAVTDTAVMTADQVRELLARAGLADPIEVIVTSADIGAPKPDPRGIQAALAELRVGPDSALFLGDADVDELAAARAGVRFARATPGHDPGPAVRVELAADAGAYVASRALVAPLDLGAADDARERHSCLTKPPGSLGRLEVLGVQLAAITGAVPPPVPTPAAVAVFAADHGVVAEGVTPWPQEVTAQMVANMAAGGAAINVLARQAGASVTIVDVGVATELELPPDGAAPVRNRRLRAGSRNLATGPALTEDEVRQARDVGAQMAAELVEAGARLLVTGEMGIGNTTPAAAVIAAITGRPAQEVTGRGTGVDDATLAHKIGVVERAVARVDAAADAVTVLREVGGLEIAALAGFVVGAAAMRVPVIADGVIAAAALAAAHRDCPEVLGYVIAGHRSTEPGATALLDHLDLVPVLDLGLRLGEGTGACLAVGVVQAAAHVLAEMASFDTAGVHRK
jgi:nicotinate-nucleotide--dimethylbenzimidazole phosphoribosyltransferase